MNCEKCSTPMLWIGSMSRGGMDCPKCAAERPVVFDMFCKPAPEAIITGGSAWRDKNFAADALTGEITTVARVPKNTVIDAEMLRKLSELALLDEAKQLGVIANYSTDTVPDRAFFGAARVAGQVVISGGGYWIATAPDEVGNIFPKHWGPPSNTSLAYGLTEANHFRALELRKNEDDRIARLTANIPCADFHYDPDLKDTTKTKG